jgi:hypothetical protein
MSLLLEAVQFRAMLLYLLMDMHPKTAVFPTELRGALVANFECRRHI